MTLQDALQEPEIKKRVDNLKKGRLTDQPDIGTITKQWDPTKHEIFNEADRPNKTVYYEQINEAGEARTLSRIEKVARIALAFQKLIVRRAASFLFGNPVKVISSIEKSKVAAAVEKILSHNKEKGLNKKIARILFSTTEVAEYWYPAESPGFMRYGFKSAFKMRVSIFSPLAGDVLYPFFSDTGDLVAFSREFKKKEMVNESQVEVTYFETWTDQQYFLYKQDRGEWVDTGTTAKIELGKIPIVYAQQEATDWNDVQVLIERLEKLVSNFGDTNDYHGSPKILAFGEVKGFSKKGESGAILQMEQGADARYLSWEQAPESIRLEIENLLRMIFSITQTPDISFDAVKGLGAAASGQSLRMLFLDAHLKVMDKMEIFDDYLERRFSILKTYVGKLNTGLASEAEAVELTPEVIPYMVDDMADEINNLVTAVSGGIMSTQTATGKNPLVDDGEKEFQIITKEKEAAMESAMELDKAQNEEEEPVSSNGIA